MCSDEWQPFDSSLKVSDSSIDGTEPPIQSYLTLQPRENRVIFVTDCLLEITNNSILTQADFSDFRVVRMYINYLI